jgi:hypothetical protein
MENFILIRISNLLLGFLIYNVIQDDKLINNLCIIVVAIKYLFINYFSHIKFKKNIEKGIT